MDFVPSAVADKRSTFCHTICYGVGEIDFTEECLYFCIEWSSAYDDFNEVSSEHFHGLLTDVFFDLIADDGKVE